MWFDASDQRALVCSVCHPVTVLVGAPTRCFFASDCGAFVAQSDAIAIWVGSMRFDSGQALTQPCHSLTGSLGYPVWCSNLQRVSNHCIILEEHHRDDDAVINASHADDDSMVTPLFLRFGPTLVIDDT